MNNKLHGLTVCYDSKGFVVSRINYFNGIRHGLCELFCENVCIKSGEFVYGKHVGVHILRYPSGNIECEKKYNTAGLLDGLQVFWYDIPGRIRYTKIYKNGVLHGDMIKYYENSIVRSIHKYVDGIFRELHTNYVNGSPKLNLQKRGGKLDGLCRSWYPCGQPRFRAVYINGEIVSDQIEWSQSGDRIPLSTHWRIPTDEPNEFPSRKRRRYNDDQLYGMLH